MCPWRRHRAPQRRLSPSTRPCQHQSSSRPRQMAPEPPMHRSLPTPGAAVPGICPCHRHRDPERRLIPFARPSDHSRAPKPRKTAPGRKRPHKTRPRLPAGVPGQIPPPTPHHPPCPRRSLGERKHSRPPARTLTGESPRPRQHIHIPATFKTTPPRRSPESKKINSKGPKGEDWRRRWKSRPSRQQHRRQTTPRLRAQSEVKT